MSELWKYRRNIFRPKFESSSRRCEYDKKTHQTLILGTYIKPLAKIIRSILKRFGYKVQLRGRGMRSGKHQNFTGDIRIQDAKFLAVYARRII